MAGFLLKNLVHAQVDWDATANSNLLTVPATHTYVIRQGVAYATRGGAGIGAFHLELSDTAGANFKRVTDQFTSAAAASSSIINLTPQTSGLQNSSSLQVDPTNSQQASIENLIMNAGQILRYVRDTAPASPATIDFSISGVDYTA